VARQRDIIDYVLHQDKRTQLFSAAHEQRNGAMFDRRRRIHMFDSGVGETDNDRGKIVMYAYDAGVHVLIGTDINEVNVAQARNEYAGLADRVRRPPAQNQPDVNATDIRQAHEMSLSMLAGFIRSDAFNAETQHHAAALGPYDIMTYFNTLQFGVPSMDALRRQFAFWRQQLTDSGVVILQTIDTRVLVARLSDAIVRLSCDEPDLINVGEGWTSSKPLVIENAFYRITWPANVSVATFPTGSPYTISTPVSTAETVAFTIDMADIHTLADEFGFEVNGDDALDVRNAFGADAELSHCRAEIETLQLYRTMRLTRKTARSIVDQATA